MNFIATFYSHFAAMTFKNELDNIGVIAKLMPVPRVISSSCGTCVKYTNDLKISPSFIDELEATYYYKDNNLIKIEE